MSKRAGLTVLLIGCPEGVVQAVCAGGHRAYTPAPEEAPGVARDAAPEVVILDLAGAGGDPFGLAREIRASSWWRKPMFIALAEAADAGLESRCAEAGIDLVMLKPVGAGLLTGFLGRLDAVVRDYESFDPAI
jgi:DNA-binding response OmpR family regulator